jgi:hypothetical protein
MNNINDIENHLEHFRKRAHRKSRAHYLASKSLSRRHIWFGTPIIFLTTIVGSSAVSDLSQIDNLFSYRILGYLSFLAAVLSAFQTFFGFSSLSAKHRTTAGQYNNLYRKMTLVRTKYLSGYYEGKVILREIEVIQKHWESIELKAIDVPDRFYDRAKSEQLSDEEGV